MKLKQLIELLDFGPDGFGMEEAFKKFMAKRAKEKARQEQARKEREAREPKGPIVWAVNSKDEVYYRHGERGGWTLVPGRSLKQISIGPVGTFGVDKNDDIFYRVGTNETKDSAGSDWQRLPGKLSWISAGLNAVWGVNASNEIYCLSPVKFRWHGTDRHVDFTRSKWERIYGGLKQISVSKNCDVVWGVNIHGAVYYKRSKSSRNRWHWISGRLSQVEVGDAGVFGIHKTGNWRRSGTENGNKYSTGRGWHRILRDLAVPGALKSIAVGRTAIWGVDAKGNVFAGQPSNQAKWRHIPGNMKQIATY